MAYTLCITSRYFLLLNTFRCRRKVFLLEHFALAVRVLTSSRAQLVKNMGRRNDKKNEAALPVPQRLQDLVNEVANMHARDTSPPPKKRQDASQDRKVATPLRNKPELSTATPMRAQDSQVSKANGSQPSLVRSTPMKIPAPAASTDCTPMKLDGCTPAHAPTPMSTKSTPLISPDHKRLRGNATAENANRSLFAAIEATVSGPAFRHVDTQSTLPNDDLASAVLRSGN